MSKPNSDLSVSARPRRLYPYKKSVLVCFGGGHYGPQGETAFKLDHPVTKVAFVDRADSTVLVTQRLKGKKGVTETWHRFGATESDTVPEAEALEAAE
ncbi:MAG: hypothetical protein NUV49_00155 [Patescibacteria group bacterium]|nr:hypothetical protein [Patescibacteria group bacterium]